MQEIKLEIPYYNTSSQGLIFDLSTYAESKDIKFKSKAWVDMFGMRFAKGAGSIVNKLAGQALGVTGCIVIGCVGIWVVLANIIGKYFQKAVNEKRVID